MINLICSFANWFSTLRRTCPDDGGQIAFGRTQAMSRYVVSGESVFEFGTGLSGLSEMLPSDCHYTPSEMTKRGLGGFRELNQQPLPVFPRCDVAICNGVLEQILDLKAAAGGLAKSFNKVIVSYADIDRSPNKGSRVWKGWFNHLSRRKFIGKFESVGYRLDQEAEWQQEGIYVLKLDAAALQRE